MYGKRPGNEGSVVLVSRFQPNREDPNLQPTVGFIGIGTSPAVASLMAYGRQRQSDLYELGG